MRSRQIALSLRLHARSNEARRAAGDRNGSLLRERDNERRDRSAAREDVAAGRTGVQVSERKKKDDDQEDGGVQPRWHENEA